MRALRIALSLIGAVLLVIGAPTVVREGLADWKPWLAWLSTDTAQWTFIVGGLSLAALVAAMGAIKKRFATSKPTDGGRLNIELEPSVFGVDLTVNEFSLRVGVLNKEDAGQFYARVWALRGIAANAAPPWEVKWRQDAPDAYTFIKHGNKEVLEVATLVDPEPSDGLLFHFHGPREDWHGVLTHPTELNSAYVQIRVWHVELDDYVESWFRVAIGEHRFPIFENVSADEVP